MGGPGLDLWLQCLPAVWLGQGTADLKKKKKILNMRICELCFIWGKVRTVAQQTAFQIIEKLLQRGWGERSVYMWFWWRGSTCNQYHFLKKIGVIYDDLYLFLCCQVACGILVPWPGIQPIVFALEVRNLNHGMARQVPSTYFFWRFLLVPWRLLWVMSSRHHYEGF